MSRFPVAFRLPALASWSSDSRRGIGPSLRSAYRPTAGPRRGLPRFARTSCDWGGCLLYPEDGGALPAEEPAQPAPVASQRPVLAPRYSIPSSRAYGHEASTEVYAIHPSSLPLACDPWMEQGSSGFCLSFEPRRGRRRRTSGRGQATSTGLELRIRHSSNLLSSCSLVSCDLVSQDRPVVAEKHLLAGVGVERRGRLTRDVQSINRGKALGGSEKRYAKA